MIFLLLFFIAPITANSYQQAHTFFMPRLSTDDSVLLGHNHVVTPTRNSNDELMVCSCDHRLFFQATDSGAHTTPHFFGGTKKTMIIEDEGDIHPTCLGVGTDGFSSQISFSPDRNVIGVALGVTAYMDSLYEGLWARATVPIVQATHNLNAGETGSGTALNILTTKHLLSYNNIPGTALSLSGVDDVLLSLGVTSNQTSSYSLELLLPTGDSGTNEFLFQPVVGHHGHVGLGVVMANKMELWSDDIVSAGVMTHMRYRYLFESKEYRTFDLIGQPFTRYFLYRDTSVISDYAAAVENYGPNFFSPQTSVCPGGTGQTAMSLFLDVKGHCFELGYGYWFRNKEQVAIARNTTRSIGISLGEDGTLPGPLIKDEYSADDVSKVTTFAPVLPVELDVDSAAVPLAQSHIVHAEYTGSFTTDYVSLGIHFGASYEWAEGSQALDMIDVSVGFSVTC